MQKTMFLIVYNEVEMDLSEATYVVFDWKRLVYLLSIMTDSGSGF